MTYCNPQVVFILINCGNGLQEDCVCPDLSDPKESQESLIRKARMMKNQRLTSQHIHLKFEVRDKIVEYMVLYVTRK